MKHSAHCCRHPQNLRLGLRSAMLCANCTVHSQNLPHRIALQGFMVRQSSGEPPRSYAVTAVLCVLLAAFSSPSLIGTPVEPAAHPKSCCKVISLPRPCSRSVQRLLLHYLACELGLMLCCCIARAVCSGWKAELAAAYRPSISGGLLCMGCALRGRARPARQAPA